MIVLDFYDRLAKAEITNLRIRSLTAQELAQGKMFSLAIYFGTVYRHFEDIPVFGIESSMKKRFGTCMYLSGSAQLHSDESEYRTTYMTSVHVHVYGYMCFSIYLKRR